MLDISNDIKPLSSFKRDSVTLIGQLKQTGRPVVLTINGKEAGYTYIFGDVPEPGPVAFGFEGGKGTVDNVVIKGMLDMKWFLQNSMRRRR